MANIKNIDISPQLEFISAGCNRIANCIDWLLWPNNSQLNSTTEKGVDIENNSFEQREGHGWVIFGAQNGVCLSYVAPGETTKDSANSHSLVCVLNGHTSTVTSVSWIYDESGSPCGILSGGMDGNVFIWSPSLNSSEEENLLLTPDVWFNCTWNLVACLSGHEGAITFVSAPKPYSLEHKCDNLVLVSGDINSNLYLWQWSKTSSFTTIKPFQKIIFKASYALCASITYLPFKSTSRSIQTPQIILAVGNTDKKVRLYANGFENCDSVSNFNLVTTLEGHEDWVRSVAFKIFLGEDKTFLMLATAGQDRSIRLWKFSLASNTKTDSKSHDSNSNVLAAAFEKITVIAGKGQLSTRAHLFVLPNSGKWSVMLDAILIGHDDWVYSVSWHPNVLNPCLVSASADKSLMIWSPDHSSGIWINECQLGEIGGNALGLYGGVFSPDGRALLALGYKGALHLWRRNHKESGIWEALPYLSGHIGSATSVAWDPKYPYLVSTSLDQTARAFACCGNSGWREISRPQIHGYDLRRIRFISAFRYACAADEKVIRILDAPLPFVERLSHLTQVAIEDKAARSQGANLPALGLSNKAVNAASSNVSQDTVSGSNTDLLMKEDKSLNNSAFPEINQTVSTNQLPFEEELLQATLWPEMDKLYGHGYELVALAVSPDCAFIASSAKATTAEHAGLRLFSAKDFKQVSLLSGHQLTATCLAFSPNSQFLLSGSRDRSWCLYIKDNQCNDSYRLLHLASKAHGRIIWDVQFAPDSIHFLTASRDKTVKVWKISSDSLSVSCIKTLTFEHPVTSLAIESQLSDNIRFAIGLENGLIGIGLGQLDSESVEDSWDLVQWIDKSKCPLSQVNELAFCPHQNTPYLDNHNLLAAVSADHSVRVYRF